MSELKIFVAIIIYMGIFYFSIIYESVVVELLKEGDLYRVRLNFFSISILRGNYN